MEIEEVSILDAIKRGSYEASVITTFNAYLPYYEDVFLRYLHSAGCRHNVLIMDASQLSECLSTPTLRPRYAGYSYSLIPVASNGAFHPKIVFLFSRKKGLLFVGSHNMTLSGMGLNKELTTQIHIDDGKEKTGVQIGKDVLLFIDKWIKFNSDQLPKPLLDSFNALKRFAPWLTKRDESNSSDLFFISSDPYGDSLFKNVLEMIPEPIKRISILGPFFDQDFEFIIKLKAELKPKEFIIGIEPDTVSIPKFDFNTLGIRFVDASNLNASSGYFHAKAILFESNMGNYWLITGSANPSRTAWISSPSKRNAEAIVLHSGQKAIDSSNLLGISRVDELPSISEEAWSSINQRIAVEKSKIQKKVSGPQTLIGVAVNKGIQIVSDRFRNQNFMEAICIDEKGNIVQRIERYEIKNNCFIISVPNKLVTFKSVRMGLRID